MVLINDEKGMSWIESTVSVGSANRKRCGVEAKLSLEINESKLVI